MEMDKELFNVFAVFKGMGLPVEQIKPIAEHYDSVDEVGLTNKITSIKSFKGLTTPSKINENGKYVPDFSSRYFTADFPFGLEIMIEFAQITNVHCPNMIMVDKWYRTVSGDKTPGFKMSYYGIKTIEDLANIYLFEY